MRVIVFFDLPVTTRAERRYYTNFRKFLIKSGFVMLQNSVYAKLALNTTVADAVYKNIVKNKPQTGIVEVLTITEKQFSQIKCIVGERVTTVLNSDKRTVIL